MCLCAGITLFHKLDCWVWYTKTVYFQKYSLDLFIYAFVTDYKCYVCILVDFINECRICWTTLIFHCYICSDCDIA